MKPFLIVIALMLGTAVFAGAQADQRGVQPDRGGKDRAEKGGREKQKEKPGAWRGGDRPGGERSSGGNHEGGHREAKAQAEHFLKSHDRNGDGSVNFDEFRSGKKLEHLSDEGKKRIFDHLDKSKDGVITRDELPKGPPPAPGNGGPLRGDKNGDKKLSFEEFAANPRLQNAPPERQRELFDKMDTNHDGFLSPEDWPKREDGSRGWDRRGFLFDRSVVEKLDENKDGALTFEEWRKGARLKDADPERMKEWFGRLDRNKDGKLDEADRGGPSSRRPPGGTRSDGEKPKRPESE